MLQSSLQSKAELNINPQFDIQDILVSTAELKVDLRTRYLKCTFLNTYPNIEPTARYSKCVFSNVELNAELHFVHRADLSRRAVLHAILSQMI